MNMVYIANTSPEDEDILHFGRKGQTWYVRNYQSYEVAPTRSGKVGEERGEAAMEPQYGGDDEELFRPVSKKEAKQIAKEQKKALKYEKWRNKKLSKDKFVKKNFGNLTNEELAYHIEREQLRKQMDDLKEARRQGKIRTIGVILETFGSGAVSISKAAAAVNDVYNMADNIKKKGMRKGPTPSNVQNTDQRWRAQLEADNAQRKFENQMSIERFKYQVDKDADESAYRRQKDQSDMNYKVWEAKKKFKNNIEVAKYKNKTQDKKKVSDYTDYTSFSMKDAFDTASTASSILRNVGGTSFQVARDAYRQSKIVSIPELLKRR